MKKLLIPMIIGAALAGCSSSPDSEMAKRLVELEKSQQEMIALQKAQNQAEREKEMDVMPDWFLEPPKPDSTGFFGVGFSKSKNPGFGLKAARLQAEADLAKQYKQEISGSERSFEQGNGDGDVTAQTTFLIDKIMDSVPVVGYTVVEQIMEPVDGVYQTYVLLKLPYDEFNKVLLSEKSKSFDKAVQGHFDDLERRLKDRRAERSSEEQRNFEREQEALKTRAGIVNAETQAMAPAANAAPAAPVFKTEQPSAIRSPLDAILGPRNQ